MRSGLFGLALATIPSHFRYLRWPISTSEDDEQLSDWKCKKKKKISQKIGTACQSQS
jgi:hypothetical protein